MSGIIKLLSFVLLLIALFCPTVQAQVITAASCSQTDVQIAFSAVVASTRTITIPAGTCHWTTQVTLTVPSGNASLTVLGAGSLTTLGGGDATVIVDDFASNTGDLSIVTGSASSTFRLAGITFEGGGGSVKFNGMINMNGFSQNVRMDHIHFLNPVNTGAGIRIWGWQYGVFDHNLCDMNVGSTVNNCFRISSASQWNGDTAGQGDMAWADLPYLGTNKAIFIEDNTVNNGYVDDCDSGSHMVIRHNTLNNATIQAHEMSNDMRGCRVTEVYQNVLSGMPNSITIRAGTGLAWGNSGTKGTNTSFLEMDLDRSNTNHGFATVPANWGYCGTQATGGVTSSWDQADSTSTGYACLDQPGRGKGDLLRGYFPNKVNSTTGTVSWPRQAIEPWYEFNNGGIVGGAFVVPYNTSVGCSIALCVTPANANRDYYQHDPSFDGTVGTGTGLLSARPATCTAGPGGNTPGVAYWATDQNTLYVCNPTNTWTNYYTPFTYPHPLTAGQTAGAPAAPTNLTVSVQ